MTTLPDEEISYTIKFLWEDMLKDPKPVINDEVLLRALVGGWIISCCKILLTVWWDSLVAQTPDTTFTATRLRPSSSYKVELRCVEFESRKVLDQCEFYVLTGLLTL